MENTMIELKNIYKNPIKNNISNYMQLAQRPNINNKEMSEWRRYACICAMGIASAVIFPLAVGDEIYRTVVKGERVHMNTRQARGNKLIWKIAHESGVIYG